MKKLYEKTELMFVILCIVIYVVSQSVANSLSSTIGIYKSANAFFNVILTIFLLCFIWKNGLFKKYRFCKPIAPASRFIWYIPLAIFASRNLWMGVTLDNYADIPSLLCDAFNMLLVGIVEEVLFRGLLFNAIAKDGSVKSAIVISSATFGLGHIINLINGSGAELVPNLCQVVYAVVVGFLFVTIYYRGGSIIPCIIAHSFIDVASVFGNWEKVFYTDDGVLNNTKYILYALSGAAFALAYTLILLKTLPKQEQK